MFSLVGLTMVDVTTRPSPGARFAEAFCLALYYLALTGFCRAFLTLRRRRRIMDALTLPILAATVAAIFGSRLGFFHGATADAAFEALQAALLLALFVRGLLAKREGFTPARFYLWAFVFVALGLLVNDLNAHRLLLPRLHLTRAFDSGTALQALLFALALADRNRALSALVSLDGLTAIANRRSFDTALAQAWYRARRAGAALGVLMIDVDHFKRFNDSHGHQAGDDVLRQVAKAVQAAVLRPDDVAARYGGEEFAIVLPLAEGEAARVVGERVRTNVRALELPYPESPGGVVTVSVGVASMRPRDADASAIVSAADRALYQAKREGRDRVILAPAEHSSPDPAFR